MRFSRRRSTSSSTVDTSCPRGRGAGGAAATCLSCAATSTPSSAAVTVSMFFFFAAITLFSAGYLHSTELVPTGRPSFRPHMRQQGAHVRRAAASASNDPASAGVPVVRKLATRGRGNSPGHVEPQIRCDDCRHRHLQRFLTFVCLPLHGNTLATVPNLHA